MPFVNIGEKEFWKEMEDDGGYQLISVEPRIQNNPGGRIRVPTKLYTTPEEERDKVKAARALYRSQGGELPESEDEKEDGMEDVD
jgi:hypothetical protein